MCKSFTILILITTFSFVTNAQKVVKGQILEVETNEPVVGATIIEIGPNKPKGSISDYDGNFELKTDTSQIQISFLGFESQNFQISGDTFLTVVLKYNAYELEAPLICYNPAPKYKLPPSLKVLDYKDLNVNNSTIITPALNRVPGVYMQSGALNTNRLTIRGIGNRSPFTTSKIKVYIDDIPLTNGSGETTFEDTDLSILGSVDVLKGPTSSIYGAGLGGMLYLKTPDATIPETEFSLDNTFGSYGLIRNVVNFRRSTDGKNLINVNLNKTLSDGYRENNRYNKTSLAAYGKVALNDKEVISIFGNYVFVKANIPSSLDSFDYVFTPQKAAPAWARAEGYENYRKNTIGASYRSEIGTYFSQSSSLFTAFRTAYENRPFNILREQSFIVGARTEWAYKKSLSGWLNHFETRLGLDYFNERYSWLLNDTDGLGSIGTLLSDNGENRNYYNIFSQLKFNLKHTEIIAGINLNDTYYRSYDYIQDKTSARKFPLIWSPFFSIGYDLGGTFGWDADISFYAKVSQGFSPPTLEETLNPDGRINPDILPEQGWNYEIGSRGNIFRKLNYTFSIYSMQIKDLLVARRINVDQYVGINAGKTAHNGFEIELDYPFRINKILLKAMSAYTFADYKFKEFVDGDDDFSGNQLTGAPRHIFNAGIEANISNFYGNIQYNFVSEMPMNDSNSAYSDAYQLMNVKAGYLLSLESNWSFDFYGGINNIWNEKYASMIQINASSFGGQAPRYYYPGLPTNFYVGVKIAVNLR